MTPKEFIMWMKGFVTACPHFHPTPEQWDLLKDQLEKVETKEPSIHTGYAHQVPDVVLDTIPGGITTSSPLPPNFTTTATVDKDGKLRVYSNELIQRTK